MATHSGTFAWKTPWAIIREVAKSRTRPSDFTFTFRVEKRRVQAGQERIKLDLRGRLSLRKNSQASPRGFTPVTLPSPRDLVMALVYTRVPFQKCSRIFFLI